MRSVSAWPDRVFACAVTGVSLVISLMSAPAANDLSPAPVKTTPRTSESSRASSNADRNSEMVFAFRALSTLGRLMVT